MIQARAREMPTMERNRISATRIPSRGVSWVSAPKNSDTSAEKIASRTMWLIRIQSLRPMEMSKTSRMSRRFIRPAVRTNVVPYS